jgi:hypothetical protein
MGGSLRQPYAQIFQALRKGKSMLRSLGILTTVALLSLTNLAQADCKSDIQGILKSLETSGPYHLEMTMVSAGTTTKMSGDIIMPHSVRMTGEGLNMVMTPNGVWMDQGSGKLMKMPDEMREQMQGMMKQGMNLGVQAVDKVECPGRADFEGSSYTLYKYEAKADFMGVNTESSVNMHVDGNNKPAWLVVDGEAMGVKSVTTQKITFDDAITIADPQ